MQIRDSVFCFLNSHLAAGNDELERRNSDFREICKKIIFATQLPNEEPKYSTIFDCE